MNVEGIRDLFDLASLKKHLCGPYFFGVSEKKSTWIDEMLIYFIVFIMIEDVVAANAWGNVD